MTIEVSELKDYWCIVSYNGASVLVIALSEDLQDDDLICDGPYADDNGIDCDWTRDAVPGLFHLVLKYTDDCDDIEVESKTMLYAIPLQFIEKKG